MGVPATWVTLPLRPSSLQYWRGLQEGHIQGSPSIPGYWSYLMRTVLNRSRSSYLLTNRESDSIHTWVLELPDEDSLEWE
eukprot:11626870-Ditylum_brightwellii.AAC.1